MRSFRLAYETKRFFYLCRGEKTVYILAKHGFREDAVDEDAVPSFRQFIAEKTQLPLIKLQKRGGWSGKARLGLALLGLGALAQGAVWYLGLLDRLQIHLETGEVIKAVLFGVTLLAAAIDPRKYEAGGRLAKWLPRVFLALAVLVLVVGLLLSVDARNPNRWLWVLQGAVPIWG